MLYCNLCFLVIRYRDLQGVCTKKESAFYTVLMPIKFFLIEAASFIDAGTVVNTFSNFFSLFDLLVYIAYLSSYPFFKKGLKKGRRRNICKLYRCCNEFEICLTCVHILVEAMFWSKIRILERSVCKVCIKELNRK